MNKTTILLKKCRRAVNVPAIMVTNTIPKLAEVEMEYDNKYKLYRIYIKKKTQKRTQE